MDFSEALIALRAGRKVSRNGWEANGLWLERDASEVDPQRDVIRLHCPRDGRTVWMPMPEDLLSDDWHYVG